MFTVVIPYFQRRAGILHKALQSVAAQQACTWPVEVIVVDDASPVPAEAELEGINWPSNMTARVLRQANAGPGGARNTGLSAADAASRWIAFLDSDDEWSATHLARAAAALEAGGDLYFADHYQLGQTEGAFARAGRISPAEHRRLPGTPEGLHSFDGDLFDQTLRANVIGTSTVVFRRAGFEQARFLVEFTSAGEDYLFWMTLAQKGARGVFSSEVEAVYGKGVNVFAGSGWGTPAHAARVQQEIRFRLHVLRYFSLNRTQRQHLQADLHRLREAFVRAALHHAAHRYGGLTRLLAFHLRMDPAIAVVAPATVLGLVWQRLRPRSAV